MTQSHTKKAGLQIAAPPGFYLSVKSFASAAGSVLGRAVQEGDDLASGAGGVRTEGGFGHALRDIVLHGPGHSLLIEGAGLEVPFVTSFSTAQATAFS